MIRAVASPKAVGYVRASTIAQEIGPDAQRAAIAEWCTRHGVELVAVYEDLGVSGGAGLEQRPGLVSALQAVPKGGILLAAKRDRIARDVILSAMVERLVERKGATVRTTDGASDATGPEGALMRTIIDAFASRWHSSAESASARKSICYG